MPKILLSLFFLSLFIIKAAAQDFQFGEINPLQMDMIKYDKDTSAHAVVLDEYGTSTIMVNNSDNIVMLYKYHVKIKLFDKEAFDYGTVNIPVYNNSESDSYENVEDIKGVTYYKDDNGLTQTAELSNNKIYPVRENKHWANYKFALPGIRSGSIIEYSYTIESPYFENFHSWKFQWDIPKVRSEYRVHIPAICTYNASIRGALKLSKNKAELERSCFTCHGTTCDCSDITYGISDVPAFISEDYMTSEKNFMSAISFELVDYTSPYNGAKTRFSKDWKDIDYQLKTESYFGSQVKRKGLFKDRVGPLIASKTNDLEKAKAVYAYIQKTIKWNKNTGIVSVDGLSKALDTHSGSIADINISLVAALNAAGLNASPVLVSTRDNGIVNTLYPVTGDFNYVIADVKINEQEYLLDATDPLLPFGMLPMKCLNDKGRVISMDKPSYWIELNKSQKEDYKQALTVTLQENGKLKGTLTNFSSGYRAYLRREAIKKFNSIDEYVEDYNSKYPRMMISKSSILNLDTLDAPLIEQYDVEIKFYDKLDGQKISFSPVFFEKITVNPFKLDERSYPVDMGMPSNDRFTLIMTLPAGYTVKSAPKDVAVGLPNNTGKFVTSYQNQDNTFIFSNLIQFNKSVYNAEEYLYLKELYNKIIQSEKEEMVIAKN